nr:hypothetical protein CKG001_08760 [Bdellovibrio sp. CKG001]
MGKDRRRAFHPADTGVKIRFRHAHGLTLVEKVKGCKVLSTALTGRHKLGFRRVHRIANMTQSKMSSGCHKDSFLKPSLF